MGVLDGIRDSMRGLYRFIREQWELEWGSGVSVLDSRGTWLMVG